MNVRMVRTVHTVHDPVKLYTPHHHAVIQLNIYIAYRHRINTIQVIGSIPLVDLVLAQSKIQHFPQIKKKINNQIISCLNR